MKNAAQKFAADICTNCETRRATMNWVGEGGALAFTHGMYTRWCDVCATRAQLEYAAKQAALIPELEAKLTQLMAAERE